MSEASGRTPGTEHRLEPLAETLEAVEEYGPFVYENQDLLERLETLAHEVAEVVPQCVGLSITLLDTGTTFTLVASNRTVATLDAVQYVDDGPCVRAIDDDRTVTSGSAADEPEWPLFTRAKGEHAVASTLSLPILEQGQVIGSFNLYATTATAFQGHHDELATVLGAWSGGALTDADLAFTTRDVARRAPAILHAALDLSIVAAVLADELRIEHDDAAQRIDAASVRAGITRTELVDALKDILLPGPTL